MILCHGKPAQVQRESARTRAAGLLTGALLGLSLLATSIPSSAFPHYPITPNQRGTARQVAEAGVPLSALAPNAPDSYTVKRGDTLWDISKLFLRSPWRWPELWGMNMEEIRNPHLIYPGQELYLIKSGGRARLSFGKGGGGTVKLSPRVRASELDQGPIASIPMHLIEPFLNEAIVLSSDELARAPRIVSGREGRSLLGRGDTAYVRGELAPIRHWRVFREAKPLKDPSTGEILGYEAPFVGLAEYMRPGEERVVDLKGGTEVVPATFMLGSVRQEAVVGDRLAQSPVKDTQSYVPHAPTRPLEGQIVSIYGGASTAGQNQIVAINRGERDGVERGHVLSVLQTGLKVVDRQDAAQRTLKLPDEPQGYLFVFRVFERVSYALILRSEAAVQAGDRFTQP